MPAAAKVDLPSPIPERDAGIEQLLGWVTDACGRQHNPIVAVRRYGYQLDARLELIFANGDHVRVRQRELMGANGLRHVLMAYDGTAIADYGQGGCGKVVSRIIWASEASVHDDELEAFLADVAAFLSRSLNHQSGGLIRRNYRDDGYKAIADLAAANRMRSGARDVEPPALMLDTSADPMALWVPRAQLLAYLRDVRSKADPADVRSLLEAVGWQPVDFQRRQPRGTRRPHARVWVAPVPWDQCPFDLEAAVTDAMETKL